MSVSTAQGAVHPVVGGTHVRDTCIMHSKAAATWACVAGVSAYMHHCRRLVHACNALAWFLIALQGVACAPIYMMRKRASLAMRVVPDRLLQKMLPQCFCKILKCT